MRCGDGGCGDGGSGLCDREFAKGAGMLGGGCGCGEERSGDLARGTGCGFWRADSEAG